jgi:hypothetical protein
VKQRADFALAGIAEKATKASARPERSVVDFMTSKPQAVCQWRQQMHAGKAGSRPHESNVFTKGNSLLHRALGRANNDWKGSQVLLCFPDGRDIADRRHACASRRRRPRLRWSGRHGPETRLLELRAELVA